MFVRRGAHLIDFDQLAHEVQKPERAAWEKVVQYFGEEIMLPDKYIDRNKLGKIVFANPEKLAILNQIVHPYVFLEWHDYLEKIGNKEKNAIIIAAVPLLFEIQRQDLFDVNILVIISPEEQLKRLVERSGLEREDAQKRILSQMPIEQKVSLADIVIDNQGSLSETQFKVEKVWQKLLTLEKEIVGNKKNKLV
jgi:dephospho-CoA kinase